MEQKINRYLRKNHVMSIAVTDNESLWSAPVFYAFDEIGPYLIFKSQPNTKHSKMIESNCNVACAVFSQQANVMKLQGAQITGTAHKADQDNDLHKEIRKRYYFKLPYAAAIKGDIFYIDIESVKYTDNTLGFGEKKYYEKSKIS